jgi:LysM repeat protein
VLSPAKIAALVAVLIAAAATPTAFTDAFRRGSAARPAGEQGAAQVVAGCDTDPDSLSAVEAAITGLLAKNPINPDDASQIWRLHSVCVNGDWAYGFVMGYHSDSLQPLPSEAEVALAYRTEFGWEVVLPHMDQSYFQALQAAPEALVPGATKALMGQPSLSADVRFSQFNLPWPAGDSAYVIRHWYRALDFSIGQANGNLGIIRNAKAGTAVFVKASSTRECGNPPPDLSCWLWANAVVIQSAPNEFAWYLHLAPNSVPEWIVEGAHVPAGVDIGREGSTGWSTSPHLHFHVASTYGCCVGEGDSRMPHWPLSSMQRVNFNEHTWETLPWRAVSGNAAPSGPSEPSAPPSEAGGQPPAAPVDAPPPEASGTLSAGAESPASACPNPYLVQRGDWLLKIAQQCGVTMFDIVAANPGIRPQLIYAGQMLNMPGGRAVVSQSPSQNPSPPPAAPAAPAEVTTTVTTSSCSGAHIVARGENLFRIAFNCGLSTAQLASFNGIRSPYTIYPGQEIRFP